MIKQLIKRIILIFKLPIYKLRNNKIDITSEVGSGVFMQNCNIGKYCYLGPNSFYNDVITGNYCCFAPGVQIGLASHNYKDFSISPKIFPDTLVQKQTIIGNDVWVGVGANVMGGVTIGTGAIIGAHTFVNKDVPPYSIVVGVPGRIIKYRFENQTINKLLLSKYWQYKPEDAKKCLKKLNQR